jgi:hypothetical protein
MRAAAGLALLLAGCSASGGSKPAGDLIDCAVGGAAAFTHDCSVERAEVNGARLLIVHHPDGRFRRFQVVDGGKSLAAADGAAALAVASNGERVDVGIDNDRYRIPTAMLRDDRGR